MKILYVIPDGIDLGGIITATEAHIAGLQEIGHDVTFIRLRDTVTGGVQGRSRKKNYDSDQWAVSNYKGIEVHPLLGWTGPYYSMNNPRDISAVRNIIASHELVIWGLLFGFKNDNTCADPIWMDLFDEDTPAITILHDDHLWDRQAWIANLDKHAIQGWACVHHCSYHLSEGLRGRRALIFNGHDVSSLSRRTFRPWTIRKDVFSVQNAKPWKKVNKFVAMARHLGPRVGRALLGGDGIELRYMRSKEKCKDAYKEGGVPIWQLAEESGRFKWLGPMGEAVRDSEMRVASFLCDFSTRKNAGMFNRVFVEAALQGCITLANPKFMSGQNGEAKDLLRPGRHYLPVDTELSPVEIAQQVTEHVGNMTSRRYTEMQENLRDLCLYRFDRVMVARQLVELGLGKPTGFAPGLEMSQLYYSPTGPGDKDKARRAFSDMMYNFGQAFSHEET